MTKQYGRSAQTGLYPKAYGAWAGFPSGHPPDYTLCCESVSTRERFSHYHQCYNKRGHGPEGAYCKVHDPAKVEARLAKSRAKSEADWQHRRLEIYGPGFFETLKKIADGHNDPTAIARAAIKKFEDRA